MGIREAKNLITGEQISRARRELQGAGLAEDSPELQRLLREIDERDDYLWERYAKILIESHPGEWAAVSLDGRVLLGPSSVAIHQAARDTFGPGNFVYGRLSEYRGIDMSRCRYRSAIPTSR